MTSAASRRPRSSGSRALAGAVLVATGLLAGIPAVPLAAFSPADAAAGADARLQALRAARRAAVRAATATAQSQGEPAPFSLLVVPVDFADQRLPDGWAPGSDLRARLNRLQEFFTLASCGRAELIRGVAPLVRLPGVTADYSDRGWAGFTRTRRLAAEAIAGARDAGVVLANFDNDGPDGRPGTADDDGEVDGILLLHNDIGDENDPVGGLVQALQYYLEDPVADGGTLASLYAVASLHSRLGIWAHETAHLFGLEDRYDPYLPVSGGDVAGRGGLGMFSLMAAGAFGAGDGQPGDSPALPDAYSASLLGWRDVVTRPGVAASETAKLWPPYDAEWSPRSAEVWRVWTQGAPGPEFFLLETREPFWGFDGDLPGGQLLVLHVDERVPERGQSSADPDDRHLRVRLVEADGDGTLAAGLDTGGLGDLFPGTAGRTAFTPTTWPASDGYGGPTEVALTGIAPSLDGEGVTLTVSDATTLGLALEFAFAPPAAPGGPRQVVLSARETGIPPQGVTVTIRVKSSPAWGSFAGRDSVVVGLLYRPSDRSWFTDEPPFWTPDPPSPEAPAATLFQVRMATGRGGTLVEEREWSWSAEPSVLGFADAWPGAWTVEDRSALPGTSWHRWNGEPSLRDDGEAVLACTGSTHTTAAAWPEVSYGNRADLTVVSGALPDSVTAVRLVHCVDGELARPGVAYDAALVEFLLPDGTVAAGEPVGGYRGAFAAEASHSLHGRPAFAAEDSATLAGPWRWRMDVVPVPRALSGPVRLRLRFASDEIYRGRGWFVAEASAIEGPVPASAFPAAVVADGGRDWLAWSWPGASAASFEVETSDDNGASWATVWTGVPAPGPAGWASAVPAAVAGGSPAGARRLFRVVAHTALGLVASRGKTLHAPNAQDGAPRLVAVFPNPARAEVFAALESCGEGDRVAAFDLRGRRLREWTLLAGSQVLRWDGRDGAGRSLPAGVYLFALMPRNPGAAMTTGRFVWLP